MQYAYLGSNAITFIVWLFLYWRRKDLRKMMLTMSVCAMPLALFDLIFVPSYWTPVTLFHIPIGIEGFIFSFCVGGIAAVPYAELAKKRPRHIRAWRGSLRRAIWVPVLTFIAFTAAHILGAPNPEIAGYIAMVLGITVVLLLRKDLAYSTLLGGLAFGVVYFLALKLWVSLFPGVQHWFVFHAMPPFFVWGVPGWEALFGMLFGAYWVNLYEVLFGYELVPIKSQPKARRQP
jgi:hypothetical protein